MNYFSVKNIGIAFLFFMLGVLSNVSNLFRKNLSTSHTKKEDVENHQVVSNEVNQKEEKESGKTIARTKKTFYATGKLKEESTESIAFATSSKLSLGVVTASTADNRSTLEEVKKEESAPNIMLGFSFNPVFTPQIMDFKSVEVMGGWRPIGNLWMFVSANPTEVVNLIVNRQGSIESVARVGTFYLF